MVSDVIIMGNSQSPARARGRLIFALDATGSREATWNIARDLQAKMFREAAPVGQLELQLVYYGGTTCQHSRWHQSGERLVQLMNKIESLPPDVRFAGKPAETRAPPWITVWPLQLIDGDTIM